MKSKGFTLIELMIVVAIIGILSAIAIPKFADLVRKSNEGATRGNLASIRSALSIYYSDNEGQYPTDPASLTTGAKYMKAIPEVKIPPYPGGSAFTSVTTPGTPPAADGNWGYNPFIQAVTVGGSNANKGHGDVWVNSTDTDSKGTIWNSY